MTNETESERSSLVDLVLEPAGAGRLKGRRGEDAEAIVTPVQCFPMSHMRQFISLRDGKGEEFALVDDPQRLEAGSREVLLAAVAAGGFAFEVIGIRDIRKDFELRAWDVETAAGFRSFQTALDTWPRELEDGSHVVEDVFGDVYRFPPVDRLDRSSAEHLWALVG